MLSLYLTDGTMYASAFTNQKAKVGKDGDKMEMGIDDQQQQFTTSTFSRAVSFFRHDENVMVENAVDGVFVPNVPFSVSSNPKYGEGMKYTNILMMPKSKKILPIGPDAELDIVIAPGTEFKLEDTLDGTQNLWMCGAQPFYDE